MRRLLVILAAVCAVALVPTTVVGAGESAFDGVTVDGAPGEKPVITYDAPLKVKSSVTDVLAEGAGTAAAKGDEVVFDYVIVNGRTGAEVETSFGAAPVSVVLDKTTISAVVDGLVGAQSGSRVLLAVAPKDWLTPQGTSPGVKKNDTLLFVIDVREVRAIEPALERATGTAVEPPAGLPEVTLKKQGKPKITMPDADAPAELGVHPLIAGDGPLVEAGQRVTVHYTGALWDSGKVFDSSWKRGDPAQFPIGVGQVITGWDAGLVGQPVGSQVLLVIPPDQGYGANGNPQAGISGTDTLVFVVDILAAT